MPSLETLRDQVTQAIQALEAAQVERVRAFTSYKAQEEQLVREKDKLIAQIRSEHKQALASRSEQLSSRYLDRLKLIQGLERQAKELLTQASLEHMQQSPTGSEEQRLQIGANGAKDTLIKAAKASAGFWISCLHLADSYLALGRMEDALRIAQILIDLKDPMLAKPANTIVCEVYYRSALIYQERGDKEAAKHQLEQALKINPDYQPAVALMGNLTRSERYLAWLESAFVWLVPAFIVIATLALVGLGIWLAVENWDTIISILDAIISILIKMACIGGGVIGAIVVAVVFLAWLGRSST